MFTFAQIAYPLLRILCIVIGAYMVLKALWILRIGENERGFMIRGIVGVVIGTLPWWGFLIYLTFAHPVISHN